MYDAVVVFVAATVLAATFGEMRQFVSDLTSILVLLATAGGIAVGIARTMRKWLTARTHAAEAVARREEAIAEAIETLPSLRTQLIDHKEQHRTDHDRLEEHMDDLGDSLRSMLTAMRVISRDLPHIDVPRWNRHPHSDEDDR